SDYEQSARLMDALHHLPPPLGGLVPVRVDRFSPFFTTPEHLGIRNLRPDRAYRHVYDLPDEVLANLAYYFEFDYADGRSADEFLAPVRRAMDRWVESRGNRGLAFTDDGARLGIGDFRPGADRLWTPLTGIRRELYLYCDQHRSWRQLAGFAGERGMAPDAAQAFLMEMVERRLMITADGHFLSLAICADGQRDAPAMAAAACALPN
ncbi:MAG: hypothetical protein ABIQ49_04535, partial [Gemmatimonadales bacterium]